jgi:phage gp29-like protein
MHSVLSVMGRVGKQRPAPDSLRLVPLNLPAPWHDRDPQMMGNSLTPSRLTQILNERNQGFLRNWVDLADEAREKDPHLHSQLSIREQSVVETDYDVLPGEGSNQKAAKRAAAAWKEKLQRWKSMPEEGLDQWLAEIVGGNYYGRSLHQVLWDRVEGETFPERLELTDTRRLSLAAPPTDPTPNVLRILDADDDAFDGTYGTPISELGHPDQWLVNRVRVRGSQQTREGLFAVVVWYWLFRIWSWRDLMALTEMIGRPPVIGYYSAGGARADSGGKDQFNGARNASTEEIAAVRKAVAGVSGALRTVLADTTRLDTLKFQLPVGDPMQVAISKIVDAFESKAINGVDSVSDLKPGARASVEVQERTTNTFWRADCRRAGRLLSHLGSRYIAANPTKFGERCPTPVVQFKIAPPKDTSAAADRITKARGIGLPISKKWAHAELEIPEPKDGEELLAPPAPPPAAKGANDNAGADPAGDQPPAKDAKG